MTQLTYNIWIHVGVLRPFQHLSAATGTKDIQPTKLRRSTWPG